MPVGVPTYANVGNQLQVTTPQADKIETYPKATIVADRAGLVAQGDVLDAQKAVVVAAIAVKDTLLTQCTALGVT